MKRITTKTGDVFSVKIDNEYKKYMQYICNDIYMLNSDIIRAFKRKYRIDSMPDIENIVNDEVDFYAHCVTKWGIKNHLWEKVGNTENLGEIKNILFKNSSDYGVKKGGVPVKISEKWYVWRIGDKETVKVGKLEGANRKAEIGIVIPPYMVVHRIRTGKYDFVYPGFE